MNIDRHWYEVAGAITVIVSGAVMVIFGIKHVNTVCAGLGMVGFGLYLMGKIYW